MKKNRFLKLFMLALMTFFTISACQHEDFVETTTDPSLDSGIDQAEYKTLLNELKSHVNSVVDTRISERTTKLTNDRIRLASSPYNEELQLSILTNAIQIEGLNTFKSTTEGAIAQLSATTPSECFPDGLKMVLAEYENQTSTFNGSWKRYVEREWPFRDRYEYSSDIQNVVKKFNTLIDSLQSCDFGTGGDYAEEIEALNKRVDSLANALQADSIFFASILKIADGKSEILSGLQESIDVLADIKANKIKIEGGYLDLIDVYGMVLDIQDSIDVHRKAINALTDSIAAHRGELNQLQDSIKAHRLELNNLTSRVKYIEETEIPTIWEGLEMLYDYIGDVYDTLDHRVTGLTFKPEYDFGPGLSSLILVKGISAWEPKTVDGGFGYQKDEDGPVYKAVTRLRYDVYPSNVTLDDFEVVDLLYQTTNIITRSTNDPLLKIIADDENFKITLENGVLSVPVLIHKDLAPIETTSFFADATKNIKLALRIKNLTDVEEYNLPDEPDHYPSWEDAESNEDEGDFKSSQGEEDEGRYIVSSEYVTLWLGLFDGSIAMKENGIENPTLFPKEIVKADFLNKNYEDEASYPFVTLLVTNDQAVNQVNVANLVQSIYYDQFEKKYSEMNNNNFEKDFTLTYEMVDLGNSAADFVTLGGSTVTVTDKQKAIGETIAIKVEAKVGGEATHAVGYVRVLVISEDKEIIDIPNKLQLDDATLSCSQPVEFSVETTVKDFVKNNILDAQTVNAKTKITDADIFYDKYTALEINSVNVSNENASLPSLTPEDLKALFTFEYLPAKPYIKGTISNTAPMGTYTVVTTLKSTERIPDIKITWQFKVKTPKLIWVGDASGNLVIDPTTPDMSKTGVTTAATYEASLTDLFKKSATDTEVFEYTDLVGQICPDYILPYFVFTNVPSGYTISTDGKSVSKNGTKVAAIELIDILDEAQNVIGNYYGIKLIENNDVYGLVGSDDIKVAAKGTINEGIYFIYPSFSVKFSTPLLMKFPENAKFSSSTNIYSVSLYKNNNSVNNVVRDLDENELTLYDMLPSKLFINHYGIDFNYDTSLSYSNDMMYAPYKFDLENVTFNKTVSGLSVILESFRSSDVTVYYGQRTPIRYRFKLVDNSTGGLPEDLTVTIPVTLKCRWGLVRENFVIKVN